MGKINLEGQWNLCRDDGDRITGHLPGCTYLDYIAHSGVDPFWGKNETEAGKLAHHSFVYSKVFQLNEEQLDCGYVDFVADGLDTICTVLVNGQMAGKANNINRIWRFDIRKLVKLGENTIELHFADPFKAMEECKLADAVKTGVDFKGQNYLRKTACHFGWDWGPKLPPAGVTRYVAIEYYNSRFDDVKIIQDHRIECVYLHISTTLIGKATACELVLTDPQGEKKTYKANSEDGKFTWDININDPQLWWCNGLGEQPLYQLDFTLHDGEQLADTHHKQIGLRTIIVDTEKDELGDNFRFIINGIPIFAKGANWIPADSFITRANRETYDYYVRQAKYANMNMMRVWGGGMYECEDFYDSCDRNGILVWQDFLFACDPYPLHIADFVENVHQEVIDNVKRLRHRASLAIWCGNNELNPFMITLKKPFRTQVENFFYDTLREWTEELDGSRRYWAGSPDGGGRGKPIHDFGKGKICGDSHLWNIWHGMLPVEYFRNFPTRFCSEFGMESMPDLKTIKDFHPKKAPKLFDDVMLLHQKASGGNSKMLYYLLAKYREPKNFEDFVYLSQLVQSDAVRFATENWKRNIGKQNGALMWQLNDCWPVASWSGIDYQKRLKAVMYHSRHYNKMVTVSGDLFRDRLELYVINEYPRDIPVSAVWHLKDFSGHTVNSGRFEVNVSPVSSVRACVLNFEDILNQHSEKGVYVAVSIQKSGEKIDEKFWLLVPDKEAHLQKAEIKTSVSKQAGQFAITLTSNTFARNVCVDSDYTTEPWSNNYVDMEAGVPITLRIKCPEGVSLEDFAKSLTTKTIANIDPIGTPKDDRKHFREMFWKDKNYKSFLSHKVLEILSSI